MRENRSSGSVEGVMGNHDSYSDSLRMTVNSFLSGPGALVHLRSLIDLD
jgi:hypothetical protein